MDKVDLLAYVLFMCFSSAIPLISFESRVSNALAIHAEILPYKQAFSILSTIIFFCAIFRIKVDGRNLSYIPINYEDEIFEYFTLQYSYNLAGMKLHFLRVLSPC